jgi:hypothetical protein
MGSRNCRDSSVRSGPASRRPYSLRTPPANGHKIAFTSKADGQADIYTMNAAGKDVFNVSHDIPSARAPTSSRCGRRAGRPWSFERQHATGGADLMVVNANGSNLHPLTSQPVPGCWNCHPSWDERSTVYFTSNRTGTSSSTRSRSRAPTLRQLTKTSAPVQNLGPAVVARREDDRPLPDGAPWGGNGIFLLSVTAGRLTHVIADWNGRRTSTGLVAERDADRVHEQPDGLERHLDARRPQHHRDARAGADDGQQVQRRPSAYAPDGRTLAFVSDRTTTPRSTRSHCRGNAVARAVTQLTFDKAFKANPSWHW